MIPRLTQWLGSRHLAQAIIYSCFASLFGLSGCTAGLFSPPDQTRPVRQALPAYSGNNFAQVETESSAGLLPALPLTVTPEVQRELDHFLGPASQFIAKALERREAYYPMLVEVFRDEGVPAELINVAMIESGFKPDAKSYAGAVGIWQFMKATARRYGLVVTRKEDQRRDPILATVAAARHLRDLYTQYEDWYLALAAYNAGSGSIDRAMMRAGSSDFYQLSRKKKIRLQTARYVPKIVAATIIVNRIMAPTQEQMSLNLERLRAASSLSLLR